jgi:hypothetical protein
MSKATTNTVFKMALIAEKVTHLNLTFVLAVINNVSVFF